MNIEGFVDQTVSVTATQCDCCNTDNMETHGVTVFRSDSIHRNRKQAGVCSLPFRTLGHDAEDPGAPTEIRVET